MLQEYIDIMTILSDGGLITMHEGRFIVVRAAGAEADLTEWFVIQAQELSSAIEFDGTEAFEGNDEICAVPYLTRDEAINEAYDIIAKRGAKID